MSPNTRVGRAVATLALASGLGTSAAAETSRPTYHDSDPGRYRSVECQQSALWVVELRATPPTALSPPDPLGPVVAILDGGVDARHPALSGRLLPGLDLIDGDGDPSLPPAITNDPARHFRPGNLHGTAMAMQVASLAPESWLRIYRVVDEDCTGRTSDLAAAITAAVSDGVDAILLALAIDKHSPQVASALGLADRADIPVIAAAGNGGKHQVSRPAKDRTVYAIAAVDDDGFGASFTATGPHVTLSDRGVDQLLDVAAGHSARASGTSIAAARTIGAYARLRHMARWLDRSASWQLLCDTAAPLATETRSLGVGIVDLEAAVAHARQLP